jgi:hypothetical protein
MMTGFTIPVTDASFLHCAKVKRITVSQMVSVLILFILMMLCFKIKDKNTILTKRLMFKVIFLVPLSFNFMFFNAFE